MSNTRIVVLDVMDAAAKTCLRYSHQASAENLPEARRAVAELIDASYSISRYATDTEWGRFHEALRAVKGIT